MKHVFICNKCGVAERHSEVTFKSMGCVRLCDGKVIYQKPPVIDTSTRRRCDTCGAWSNAWGRLTDGTVYVWCFSPECEKAAIMLQKHNEAYPIKPEHR